MCWIACPDNYTGAIAAPFCAAKACFRLSNILAFPRTPDDGQEPRRLFKRNDSLGNICAVANGHNAFVVLTVSKSFN